MSAKLLAALAACWWLIANILNPSALLLRAGLAPRGDRPLAPSVLRSAPGGATRARLPNCDTYIRIAQRPPDPYYRDSATFVVEYGESSDTLASPTCLATGNTPDPATFRFYVNGVDRTSAFAAGGGSASGLVTSLPSKTTDTFLATITGHTAAGVPRTDSDQRSAYVDAAPPPSIDASPTNFDDQQLAACAVGCFAATYAQSTVPYVSLGTPRSVTLAYHGDRAFPRPFLVVDVAPNAGGVQPQKYSLSATIDGNAVTFVNGEQTLYFTAPAGTRRLVGQFDGSSLTTGMHTVALSATAHFANGQSGTATSGSQLAVVNQSSSPVARGWTIAGLQRAYVQSGGSVMIAGGDGSAVFYAGSCASTASSCSFTSPSNNFTRLTASLTGSSRTYTLAFPDSTKVTFNSTGQMTKVADRSGATVQYRYDGSGRLTQVTDPWRTYAGAPTYTVLSYGANGLSQIAEPGTNNAPGGGRATGVTVNSDRTLGAITDPGGGASRFGYDAQLRLASVVNRRGDTTSFTYDPLTWKLASTVLPRVPVDNGSGGTTMAAPVLTFHAPQAAGMPTGPTLGTPAPSIAPDSAEGSVTDPGNHVTRMTLTPYGLPARVTDPLGNVTTISSTGLHVTTVVYPTGASALYGYTGAFLTSSQVAGQGTQNFRYGAFGQVDSTWGSGIPTTRSYIGVKGRIDSVMFAGDAAHKSKITYDTLNRVLVVKDPQSHQTSYHYDAVTGNLDSTQAPGNRVAVTRFDAYGRDSASRANGLPWQRVVYDLLNRPTQAYDGVNATPTSFAYDSLFQTRVTDAKGQVYSFTYDALGRLTRRTDPAGAVDSAAYDADGLQRRWTNRRGQTLSYSYDALHRLLSKSGQNATTASYGYSADGRVSAGWNSVSVDSTFVSSTGWIDSVVTRFPATGRRFQRYYRQNATLGTLDSIGISDANGTIAFVPRRYTWNTTTGTLTSIRLGTSTTALTYDNDQVLKSRTFPSALAVNDTVTAMHQLFRRSFSNATVNDALWRGYGYDSLARVDNVITRTSGGFLPTYASRTFRYDSLGRVTGTQVQSSYGSPPLDSTGYQPRTVPAATITYDAVGNRTDSSATYAAGNRLQQFGGTTFGADLDGNVTQKLDGSGNGPRYYWSADGLLDSVVAGTVRLRYEYNALGQLVRRSRDGVVDRHFLWDGDQLLAELDGAATSRVGEYAYYPGVDQPLAVITGATTPTSTRYAVSDETGSVIGLIDGTTVSEQFAYDAWGAPTASPASSTSRLRWQGLVWESDSTRLYYARNRWYDPQVGRFMTEDPIDIVGGINLFAFATGDPIGGRDPLGMCPTYYAPTNADPHKSPGPNVSPGGTGKDLIGNSYTCGCDGQWYAGGGAPTCDDVQQRLLQGGFRGFGGGGGFAGGGAGGSWGDLPKVDASALLRLAGSWSRLNFKLQYQVKRNPPWKTDKFHAFTLKYDLAIVLLGEVVDTKPNGYRVYAITSTLDGVPGRYEIGGKPLNTGEPGLYVTHRFFRPTGK